jgi:hypothetical protein
MRMLNKIYKDAPAWYLILEFYLDHVGLRIQDLFNIGHLDLALISTKIEHLSSFWSQTIQEFSLIVKQIEYESESLTELPILGGRFSEITGNKNLSIFGPHGASYLILLESGINKVQDMAMQSDVSDMVNCRRFKSRDDLGNIDVTPAAMTALYSGLTKLYSNSLGFIYSNIEHTHKRRDNCIKDFLNKNSKGCGRVYKLLLAAHIQENHIKAPPALQTARDDYNYNFDEKGWTDAMKNISKRVSLPHSSTLILKIFLRQNWTPLKQSLRTGDPNDAICKYCPGITSNSRHIFLDCMVAKCAWNFLNDLTKAVFNTTQSVDPSIIFSLGIKCKNIPIKTAILDLSTCILQFLHKTSFKDKLNSIELECFLFNCLIKTIFANKAIDRNFQLFESIFFKIQRMLSKSFRYDF